MERRETFAAVAEGSGAKASGPSSSRRVTMRAVCFDTPAVIGGTFLETIAPGSMRIADNARVLLNHDRAKLVGERGVNAEFTEAPDGIYCTVDLPGTTWADDALELMRVGLLRGCSFGFNMRVNGDEWGVAPDGMPTRVVYSADLLEVTLTPYPAYPDTSATVAGDV